MSKRSYPRVRYTGELAKPIRLQDHENDDAAIEAFDNKLKTLASLHQVDPEGPNAGWDLAVALVQAHVPGLRIPSALEESPQAHLAGWPWRIVAPGGR